MALRRLRGALLGCALLVAIASPVWGVTPARRSCGQAIRGVPARLVPREVRDDFAHGSAVVGERALWAIVLSLKRAPVFEPEAGVWQVRKVVWYRGAAGALDVRGQRREGEGEFVFDAHPDSYPVPGFLPSHLNFSKGGCWHVSARLGDSQLSFDVRIPTGRRAICASLVEQRQVTDDLYDAAYRSRGCHAR